MSANSIAQAYRAGSAGAAGLAVFRGEHGSLDARADVEFAQALLHVDLHRGLGKRDSYVPEAVAGRIIAGRLMGFDSE